MAERSCPVCGESFKPASANQVYCPPTEEQRVRAGPNTQPRSRCAKRAENAKRYGWDPSSQPLTQPFNCAHCQTACIPGENVAPHATKFCGRECKAAWHTQHRPWQPSAEQLAAKRKAARWAAAQRRLRQAAVLSSTGSTWTMGWCECGQPFVSKQPAIVACSAQCTKRRGRQAYRAKHGSYNHRRRASRFGVAYEAISPRKVFERDDYRCGICGEQTDPSVEPTTSRYPTLDHIVPISKGGPHLYTNVQCACFECNWRKRDRVEVETLIAA